MMMESSITMKIFVSQRVSSIIHEREFLPRFFQRVPSIIHERGWRWNGNSKRETYATRDGGHGYYGEQDDHH